VLFRKLFLAIVVCVASNHTAWAQDVVLAGGLIIDGSGKPGVIGDVRIRGGKIDDVGAFRPLPNEPVIDVKGLVVAPGFIDIDNHSAAVLDASLGAQSQVMQGVTTLVFGLDGEGPVRVEAAMARFDDKAPALNVLTFAGHNTARREVMGADFKRAATTDELHRIGGLVEQAMRQGAFGLTLNLESGPGAFATLDEVVELAKIVARYGGVVVIHVRSEGEKVIDGVREAIEVSRRAKVPVHISHLELSAASVWGKAAAVLAEIDAARSQGLDVTADASPYNSHEGQLAAATPETVSKLLQDVGGPGNVLIVRCLRHPEFALKTLAEIAAETRMSPAETYLQILKDGGARAITSSMAATDVRALLVHASVMIASAGGIGDLHPTGSGAFARVLGPLVRDEKLMPLEIAIRKMSALPAARLSFSERGVLKKGATADIVVFDPARIQDRSTPQNPTRLAEGIRYVFVNGVAVVKDGQPTEERPGAALR
jgi:N-acyl-D-amino-acid deacylase